MPDRPMDGHVRLLGGLARFWGAIDGNLDAWIEDIHSNGGAAKIQSHLPASLDRKLLYLKTALGDGLMLSEHHDEAARLITEINRLKMFRHTLIHGFIVEVRDDGRTIVDHSRVRGATLIRSRSTYTWTQMMRHYARTDQLQRDLWRFLTEEYFAQAHG